MWNIPKKLGPIETKIAAAVAKLTKQGKPVGRIVMGPAFHAALCIEMGAHPTNTRLTLWRSIPIEVTNEVGSQKVGFFSGPLN